MNSHEGRIDKAVIIAAGAFHDIDYVSQHLIALAEEYVDVERVDRDFRAFDDDFRTDTFLITYTSNVFPTSSQLAGLRRFLEQGGRWIAIHASGAYTEFQPPPITVGAITLPGKTATPERQSEYMDLLGCRMRAHLPVREFEVVVSQPDHEIVHGIAPFVVTDEPFILEKRGETTVLLASRYTGVSSSYVDGVWLEDEVRPQLLLHKVGQGSVAYLALGHCRGPHDMRPYADEVPPMRGSWDSPEFRDVLVRLVKWGARRAGHLSSPRVDSSPRVLS